MTRIMYIVKYDWTIHPERSSCVRVTRERAAANRDRILDVAGAQFRQHGFNGIGVADIMKAAGLTHGGFYGHFPSKEDLAAEVCERVLLEPGWAERVSRSPNPTLKAVVKKYLTPLHRDNAAEGCLLAALASDAARQPRSVRRVFTDGVKARLDALRTLVPGRSETARRKKAVATLAGIVGALILSRAVDDPALADEILDAATESFGHA
jgi:TetR/AcrR family transcriptional regulator, transcriptional repressor for nem operon